MSSPPTVACARADDWRGGTFPARREFPRTSGFLVISARRARGAAESDQRHHGDKPSLRKKALDDDLFRIDHEYRCHELQPSKVRFRRQDFDHLKHLEISE